MVTNCLLNAENYGQVRGHNRKVAKNLDLISEMMEQMYHAECYDEEGNNVVGGSRFVYGNVDRQLEKVKLSGLASVSLTFFRRKKYNIYRWIFIL